MAKDKKASGRGASAKKKTKKNIPQGIVHIRATFNNTIITITDRAGNTVAWASSGSIGYTGSRKSTPYAAGLAAENAARTARDSGMHSVEIWITGPGSGRESACRSIGHSGLRVTLIRDKTPIPHNGCRPPKRRRV
jgi:small subunit ribosomal protein S11